MSHIRWGVLGAAKIAKTAVCPAISLARRASLAALASSSSDKAGEFTRQYPGLRIHESYTDLLSDPEIDAVYIPLPNHMHVEWTEKCLRHGKHALCEKPIALKAGEIGRLIKARDESGLLAAEAFMVTHHIQWRRVRDMVRGGEIGALRQVQGSFAYNNPDPLNIRNRPETGGGGLLDIGVYPMVTTRFVSGQEPRGADSWITWENGVDTHATAHVEFDGFDLDFYCSMRSGLRQEMVFHGESGFIRATAPFNPRSYGEARLEIQKPGGAMRAEIFPEVDQYVEQIEAFCESALEGKPYACPLEFSQGNQRAIDMIFEGGKKSG